MKYEKVFDDDIRVLFGGIDLPCTVKEKIEYIESGKLLRLLGDEDLLLKLPKDNWIGGTISCFVGDGGGIFTKVKIFVTILPEYFSL